MTRPRVALWLATTALLGCAGPQPPAGVGAAPSATLEPRPPAGLVEPTAFPELMTARTAALLAPTLPPLPPEARREVALHAALYAAAYESNVGEFTRHFVLEPAERVEAAIDQRDFAIRVLAELDRLGVPVAWAPHPERPAADPDAFPGSRQLATRLGFRILDRSSDGSEVRAEIRDQTPHVGSSRQLAVARWDGSGWTIERDPVRLVY